MNKNAEPLVQKFKIFVFYHQQLFN